MSNEQYLSICSMILSTFSLGFTIATILVWLLTRDTPSVVHNTTNHYYGDNNEPITLQNVTEPVKYDNCVFTVSETTHSGTQFTCRLTVSEQQFSGYGSSRLEAYDNALYMRDLLTTGITNV